MTNPEIAAQLFLSNHTVKTHISRIFAKTGSGTAPPRSATRTATTSADRAAPAVAASRSTSTTWLKSRWFCGRASASR